MLKAGDMAPDFNLPDKDGNMVKLSDFILRTAHLAAPGRRVRLETL